MCVWRYTDLSNSLFLLTLRHKAVLLFALTQHSCYVSMCVLRGRGALMRQDYENQSPYPSQKAEAWLFAYRPVLIRLTHCDTGRVWYTMKDRAWSHCDRPWQSHVALTNCSRVCACILLLVMPSLGSGVAILPMLQFGGPRHGDIPTLSNKITVQQQVTLSNVDDWTRSWLIAEPLAG